MGLKIDRKQDKRVVHACTHMLADIPNGVTVCSSGIGCGRYFAGRDGIRRQRRCRALPRSKDRKAYRRRYRHYKSLQGGERTSFQSRRFYHVEGRRKGLQDYIYQHVGNALRHHQRRHYFRRSRHSRRSPCTCRR